MNRIAYNHPQSSWLCRLAEPALNTLSTLKVAMFLLAAAPLVYAQAVNDFYNVVLQSGADPSIIHHTDGYYYRTTTNGGNVTLYRTRTLTGLGAYESMVIWSAVAGTDYSKNVWAPELFVYNGKWYVYFAAEGDNISHRMYVLESSGSDPFASTWTFRGKMTDSTDSNAIDGTVFVINGQLYTIWSGWVEPGVQNLYIATMSNPYTIDSSRVLISTPTYSWETNTSPKVNEGPEVLIRNGKINLVYSASGSWTNTYCLGLVTASTSANLLSASSWTKKSVPIFSSANGIYGPGHCTFTKSPDGTQDWIVYHCARWSGSGWTRQLRAQKFTWWLDDTPKLGTPVSHDARIALPSGEIERWRYEAGSATLSGGAAASSSSTASGGEYVLIDDTNKAVQFTVNVPVAGTYVLAARTATDDQGSASLKVSVNGGIVSSATVVYSGGENWGETMKTIPLSAGTNTIRFTKGNNTADLDGIDIFPYDPATTISGRTFKLISRVSGKALDAAGGGTANGTLLDQFAYTASNGQKWVISSSGNGQYTLTGVASGKAVDVPSSSTANSVQLQLYTPNGTGAQKWTIASVGSGYYKLLNVNSGKAMDVRASSTSDGAAVQQYTDNGTSAQQWQLLPP